MTTILALDAAWTASEPSGVALVRDSPLGWRCVALAPSYDEFLAQADGKATNWLSGSFSGTPPDVARLLGAASTLASEPVDLITLDMPVATLPFSSRRKADDAISAEFGTRWCSAHTPNANRPGPLGARLSSTIGASGYPLGTSTTRAGETKRLIEVYPHPALLSLLHCHRRVPYKISKSRKYWPELSTRDRIVALLWVFDAIGQALARLFGPLGFNMPSAGDVASLSSLKRYEDGLDAMVCAWVGVEYLRMRTVALGDETAAIWCPSDVVGHRIAQDS